MSGVSELVADGQILARTLLLGDENFPTKTLLLFGRPALSTSDQQRSTRGVLAGAAVQGSRTISGMNWINSWPGAGYLSDVADMEAAWRPSALADQPDQLNIYLDGAVWTWFGQYRDVDIHIGENDEGEDVPEANWEFEATDPRRFTAETVTTLTSGTPELVTTPGGDEGIWRWTVVGPAIIPGIRIDDGVNPVWVMAYGGNLDSGDTLVVSSRLRQATVNGLDKAGAMFDGMGSRQLLRQFPIGGATVTYTLGSGSGTSELITRGAA